MTQSNHSQTYNQNQEANKEVIHVGESYLRGLAYGIVITSLVAEFGIIAYCLLKNNSHENTHNPTGSNLELKLNKTE